MCDDRADFLMDLRHEVANLTNAILHVANRIGERNFLYALANKDFLGDRTPESFVGGAVPIAIRRPGRTFGNIGTMAAPEWDVTGTAHVATLSNIAIQLQARHEELSAARREKKKRESERSELGEAEGRSDSGS